MRLSSKECPHCDEIVEHDGELQENGDQLEANFTCDECDTEFYVPFAEMDPIEK